MSLVNSDERRPHRLFTVAELATHTVEDVFDFTYTNLTHAKTTYLNVAKGLIALTALGVSEDDAKETLVKRGASNHALKNARQAVKVWDTVVIGGHADEAWFDRCVYMDFVAVNRAVAKCDVKTVAELGLLGKPMHTVLDKLDRLADLGVTVYKQGGAPVTPAASDVSAPSPAPSTPATPESSTTTTTTTEKSPKATKLADVAAIEKIEAAEKSILALIDVADEVTVERVVTRLLAAKLAAETARARRFPSVDVGQLKSTENRVVAAA